MDSTRHPREYKRKDDPYHNTTFEHAYDSLDNPLFQSPLYFPGDSTLMSSSHVPKHLTVRSHVNSVHWMPERSTSSRRSLPPENPHKRIIGAQFQTQHEDYSDRETSRRRSLPPDIGSPSRSHTAKIPSPSLWSVNEDLLQDGHEPMDVSPPASFLEQSFSSSTPQKLFSQDQGNRLQKDLSSSFSYQQISTPQKAVDKNKLKRQVTPIRHLRVPNQPVHYKNAKLNLVPRKNPLQKPTNLIEQKPSRFCSLKLKMLLEITGGAVLFFAALMGTDIMSYWCQHSMRINTTKLKYSLEERVFGQHIAIDMIPRVLEDHFEYDGIHNKKPLVLSLTGWTGVGKNHISYITGNHLRQGEANKIICPHHFPHHNENYTQSLKNMIIPKFASCSLSLFVIDEIDKAPDSVVDGLRDILQEVRSPRYEAYLDGKNIVFLLLSNTGATHINAHAFKAIHIEGRERESVTPDEVTNMLLGHYKKDPEKFTWFHKLYSAGLIDHIVPFLPLEKKHVIMCIKKDMEDKNIVPTKSSIHKVLDQLSFFPETELFSKSGCKKVPSKVDIAGS